MRYSLIAAYCWLRAQEITDDLIESLIQIIHRIGATAERRVERELIGTLKQVSGKNTLLCRLAETALAKPDGIIREVLFPVIGEQTLADLVKKLKSTGLAYRQHVSTVIRASYSHHYRPAMAWRLRPFYAHCSRRRSSRGAAAFPFRVGFRSELRLHLAGSPVHQAVSSSSFAQLWTGHSLPVAPHPASQRRGFLQLRIASDLSEGDLHPTVRTLRRT